VVYGGRDSISRQTKSDLLANEDDLEVLPPWLFSSSPHDSGLSKTYPVFVPLLLITRIPVTQPLGHTTVKTTQAFYAVSNISEKRLCAAAWNNKAFPKHAFHLPMEVCTR
jgi:hypothetical protein